MLAAIAFRKTHDLDELSEAAAPIYPDLEALLDHVRVRTYWGFAFRYPMPAESEVELDLPRPDAIKETLQRLHELRRQLAAATDSSR